MTEARKLPYVAAATEGLRMVLREDPNTFLCGEDTAGYGSVFGYTRGLQAEFGEKRVFDTPISEEGIIGLGVGAAACGLRPILDIMFMDFIAECMDEIVNQLAKMRYMFGGKAKLPVTICTMAGAGINLAAQHSQSLEAWIAHVPGLKVVMPSSPYDVKGLIISAVHDDNPVFVVLNKRMLGVMGEVPEEMYEIPLGKANIVRPGSNFTIVATGRMVPESLAAAEELKNDGIDVELVDPRTIQPLDSATILASVQKTHRALVVHEAVRFGGIGAEIASQIAEECFDYLDAPVGRIGAPFSPVPFTPALEQLYVPSAAKIAAEVRRIVGR
ncbi:MAG: alpha-ketoacid dehydrogenase subunit beta [Dehalococcoidia bacterium]